MFQKGIHIKDVNLSGIDLPTDDATKSALIYNAVKNTYGFPILLSNFKINGAKRDAILVSPIVLTDSVIINLGDYYLTISATAITATAGVNLIGATINSNGDVEVGRNLEVDGTSTLTGNVTMSGTLGVADDASIGGDATITGDTSIGGDANITGDADVTGVIKSMDKIVDSNGNARFVEGNMSTPPSESITLDYGKWSLSGTHLMVVASITLAPNTSLSYAYITNTINIPSYILNKVVPVISNKIDFKTFQSYVGTATSDGFTFDLAKGETTLFIEGYNLTAGETERVIRIQFDLLIDAEPAE